MRCLTCFPPFPGLGNENPFRGPFQINPTAKRVLPKRDTADLVSIQNNADAVREASAVFTDQATAMLESSAKPDVKSQPYLSI
jgi:hypothetical protein